MEPIRIACVRYLNTSPLVEGLEKVQGLTLTPTVPSRIAEMVAGGEADIGLASIVDAAESPGQLALLPVGMIGCDGPTLTVRVFSSVPLSEATRLHADTDSHTSVVLARLLLERVHGVRVEAASFDARERVEIGVRAAGSGFDNDDPRLADSAPPEAQRGSGLDEAWPETVLLIGDKVVTDAPPGERYPYQMDLGEAWKAWTGLPFVYAVWMCRAEEAGSARIRLAASLLDRQRRHNATRLGWIASVRGAAARWPLDVARRYLGELLRFEVTRRAREGAERFVREAAESGLLRGGMLRWADQTSWRSAVR